MTLIVGSTGRVGRAIVEHLREAGRNVRALVRPGTDPARTEPLRAAGATLVEGDLKDAPSLARACAGVTTVVSTASATISRGAGDSIDTVDRLGQLQLVDAARAAGVEHVVYVSFSGGIRGDFPLNEAKRAVEARLAQSGLAYTIVRPSFFMDVWLSPHTGFDPVAGSVRVYGSGDNPVSVIAAADVARYVAGTVDTPAARNRTIEIGGPEPVSWNAIVDRFERALGRPIARQHVPEEALAAQMATAPDALQRTLAGLALAAARGDVIDNTGALALVDIPLTPLQAYVDRVRSAGR